MEPAPIHPDSYRQFIERHHLDMDPDQLKGKVHEVANRLFCSFGSVKILPMI